MIFESKIENRQSKIESLDHLIRSREHGLRNRQADLLCRFEIDNQLEFSRLLHRQVGRLGSLEDSVHIDGDLPVAVRQSAP